MGNYYFLVDLKFHSHRLFSIGEMNRNDASDN